MSIWAPHQSDWSVWEPHQSAFTTLLEQACNGEDQSMRSHTTDSFWQNFCSRLTTDLRLNPRPHFKTCKQYALYLRRLCHDFKDPRRMEPADRERMKYYSDEENKKINSIFGRLTPVLSRRKSQASSSRNHSSGKRTFDSASVSVSAPNPLGEALGELLYAGQLEFEDIPEAEKLINNTDIQRSAFLAGSLHQRAELLQTMLNKQKLNYTIQETEIPDSITPY